MSEQISGSAQHVMLTQHMRSSEPLHENAFGNTFADEYNLNQSPHDYNTDYVNVAHDFGQVDEDFERFIDEESDDNESSDIESLYSNAIYHTIDLTELHDDEDDKIEEIRQLSKTLINPRLPSGKHRYAGNLPLTAPWLPVEEVLFQGHRLRCKKAVQLVAEDGQEKNAPFLAVAQIFKNQESGHVRLTGHYLFRNQGLAFLPRKMNEVYLSLHEDTDDPRPLQEQSMVQVDISKVTKIRRIKFTHQQFPLDSFREYTIINKNLSPDKLKLQKEQIRDEELLTCRWVLIKRFRTTNDRLAIPSKPKETILRRLYAGESTTPTSLIALKRKHSSLHCGILSGICRHDHERQCQDHRPEPTKLLFEDCFCGAGGSATGASQAGVEVAVGWDQDKNATSTFKQNHPNASVFIKTAYEMITTGSKLLPKVHICHMSCPCKMVSPSKTRPGKHDEENVAALMAVEEYLKARQPRFVTQEQSAGIITHNPMFFGPMINQLISAGYNVRWAIVNFMDYGLASRRYRVILVGALVGEPLPELPEITHGNAPGLKPYNSIGKAIENIPDDDPWHLAKVRPYDREKRLAPYDPNSIAKCLTCSVSIPHPSGKRPLSPRELSVLNGFPRTFKFPAHLGKTAVLEQIGNAVPPMVWEKVIGKIVECAQAFDSGMIDEAGNMIKGTEAPTLYATTATSSQLSERSTSEESHTLSPEPRMSNFDSSHRQYFDSFTSVPEHSRSTQVRKRKLAETIDLTCEEDD